MTINWDEESKGTITHTEENSDWFYNEWFYGWFDNKSTLSHTEESKGTITWTES